MRRPVRSDVGLACTMSGVDGQTMDDAMTQPTAYNIAPSPWRGRFGLQREVLHKCFLTEALHSSSQREEVGRGDLDFPPPRLPRWGEGNSYNDVLEARPEAEFPTQGGIGAATSRPRRVGPAAARRIAVAQVGQVDVAPQRNSNVAR